MRRRAQLRAAARDGHIELSAEYVGGLNERGFPDNATVRLQPVAPFVETGRTVDRSHG